MRRKWESIRRVQWMRYVWCDKDKYAKDSASSEYHCFVVNHRGGSMGVYNWVVLWGGWFRLPFKKAD